METVKYTYKILNKNSDHGFGQKNISATVSKNSNALYEFKEKVRNKYGNNIKFNHVGKIVILNNI